MGRFEVVPRAHSTGTDAAAAGGGTTKTVDANGVHGAVRSADSPEATWLEQLPKVVKGASREEARGGLTFSPKRRATSGPAVTPKRGTPGRRHVTPGRNTLSWAGPQGYDFGDEVRR